MRCGFRLSHVPPWAQAIGALLIMLSMVATFLTFRENSFAAPVVKIQTARGQTVVTPAPIAMCAIPCMRAPA